MANVIRLGLRLAAFGLKRNAAVLSNTTARRHVKPIHTKVSCNGKVCYLQKFQDQRDSDVEMSGMTRRYSKQHGRPEDYRVINDSDSDSDSDTVSRGYERSNFWRRKMHTLHKILDLDGDGLISFNDYQLLAERFKSLGQLDEKQAQEFTDIIKLTWEEQWGPIHPYNLVTLEQFLAIMERVVSNKKREKTAHRWLPYLFKAVDTDKSGYISVNEFKVFYKCLGLTNDQAAVAFAVIDANGDGKLSMKEFVKLGKDFLYTEDETRISKMFWGPLSEI